MADVGAANAAGAGRVFGIGQRGQLVKLPPRVELNT